MTSVIYQKEKILKHSDILIIEDSLAVVILLKEFLKKLSYDNVHYSQSGSGGLKLFKKLVGTGNLPIVFLDYELGDTNGLAIIVPLLKMRPDTKVIIETARERNEESVKKLLSCGAYDYLEKPIHFEKLKKIMQVLQEEENSNGERENGINFIENLLNSSTRISLERLSEYSGLDSESVLSHIKKLESEKKVVRIGQIKEISCRVCNSVKIGQLFSCHSCGNSNFKQGNLMEHFDCGNVAFADDYKDNKCPQCNKELKAQGVDYRISNNYYKCLECGNKFPEPACRYLCLKCNNKFKIDDADWKKSPGFRMLSRESES